MKRATKGSGGFTKVSTGWRYRVWVDLPDGSRQRKSFTGKTQAACRKAHEEYQKSLLSPVVVPKYSTLAEWGDAWLESRRGTVVYGTWRGYELYWKSHIRPAMGNLPVDQIIPLQIEQFLQTKQGYSLACQKAIRGVLTQIFRAGIKNGVCTKNPMESVAPLQSADPDVRIFTLAEIERIIQCAQGNPIGQTVLAMLYTGCRFEEVAALMWSDIDDGVLHIRRAVVRSEGGGWEVRERTKSGHDRVVGITPNMRDLLDSLPRRSMYLFPRDDGNFMDYDRFLHRYRKFLASAGVQYLSPHKCRHSYATYLLRGCGDFRVVQMALGHSDPRVTMRYTHPDDDDLIRAANTLSY